MSWISPSRWKKLKGIVLAEYGHQCYICGGDIDVKLSSRDPEGLSLDHVLPRSKGGSDHIENLRPAHLVCNMRKGDRLGRQVARQVVTAGWPGLTDSAGLSEPG